MKQYLIIFQKQYVDLFKSVGQKLQVTGLDSRNQAVLIFSCKFSVPLVKPVTAISTCSSLNFSWGWVITVEHNSAEKVTSSWNIAYSFSFSMLVIHNVLWLTCVSGSSSVLIISKLMNPTLIAKVCAVSHCYQDFASACVAFHPILLFQLSKKKRMWYCSLPLSVMHLSFLPSAKFPGTWVSFFVFSSLSKSLVKW